MSDSEAEAARSVGALASTERSASVPASAGTLASGTTLGDYVIERKIGQGGMGAVYRATHRTLHRAFAVKVVSAASSDGDAERAMRLVQEARAASAIDHDHIIDVTHLGHTESGLVYVVMELLDGEDLAGRLVRARAAGGHLPDDEAFEVFDQILEGLAAAHSSGVVHRDLKPANVFLTRRGSRRVAKILDFGMSKVATQSDVRLTHTGQVVGTPLYMAPEQSRGAPVDRRSDIYSLGVMMFEVLAGEVPFPATTIYECVLLHATEPAPPLGARRPELPPAVAALVARCLAKDPAARWQSASELLEGWREAWAGAQAPRPQDSGSHGRGATSAVSDSSFRSPGRTMAMAIVGACAVSLAVATWWTAPGSDPPVSRTAPASATPPPAAAPAAPPSTPQPPASATSPVAPSPSPGRTVHLESVPPAEVFEGTLSLGSTPLDLPVEAVPRILTLRRAGYRPAQQEIGVSTAPEVSVTLRPRSRGPALPPLAEP